MNNKIMAVVTMTILIVAGVALALCLMDDGIKNSAKRQLITETLQVYGNADNDWTVDEDDTSLVREIIEKNSDNDPFNDIDWQKEHPFADADHDGDLDQDDIDQINRLGNSTAEHVCFLDGLGEYMDVKCDPQRIYAFQVQNAQLAAVMGVGDRIVAGGPPIKNYADLLFGKGASGRGQWFSGDWERMSELNLDMYLVFSPTQKASPTEHLPNTDVVYLGLYEPECVNLESSVWAQGILEAGYIFNAKERAEGYIGFLLDIKNAVYDITKGIKDDEKARVLVSNYGRYFVDEDNKTVSAYLKPDTISQAVDLAGGFNLASLTEAWNGEGYGSTDEVEWFTEQKVDFVTMHFQRYAWTGEDLGVPVGGWTATDPRGMYDAIADVIGRPLLADMINRGTLNKDGFIMLPQEFRNGSTGGIMAAAYFVQAFYPEKCKEAGFNPDTYMEEFCKTWLNMGDDYDFDAHRDAIIAWGDRPAAARSNPGTNALPNHFQTVSNRYESRFYDGLGER